MIDEADYVFVMEQKHFKIINSNSIKKYGQKIRVLNIPDIYKYNQKELIDILEERVGDIIHEILV